MLCLGKLNKHAVFEHARVLNLVCLDVCRGCRGCCVEDTRAVGGGISAGVSAEKVERGTKGGECFHASRIVILLEKLGLGGQNGIIADPSWSTSTNPLTKMVYQVKTGSVSYLD